MPAVLDMSNDRANMAFTGEVPWHGLGQHLTEDAAIEVWKKEAGLDWQLKSGQVHFYPTDGKPKATDLKAFPDRTVLYRSDTKVPLSVVSKDYKVVQPGDVLEFYRDLVAAAGFKLHTAGSLRGGRVYWALAELKKEMNIMGKDRIHGYLLLSSSCDGTLATRAKFTSVRVVCQNTLHCANTDGEPTIRVPHSRAFDAVQVKKDLGVLDSVWSEFEETVKALAGRKVSTRETTKWLLDTFGDPKLDLEDQKHPRVLKGIMDSIQNSPGNDLKSAKDTAWGLVNGVTFYFDHMRNSRTDDAKLNTAWFGSGALFKRAALQNAMKLVA